MNWSDFGFLFCALLAIIPAMVLINQRQPVYSALAMLSLFLGLTGIFTMLDASFVAAMQIMVYGGAVIVVFLFVIMLLNYQPEELPFERETAFKLLVAACCAVVALGLGLLVGLGSAREVAKQPSTYKIIEQITQIKPVEGAGTPTVGAEYLPLPGATLETRIAANAATLQQRTAEKTKAEAAAAAADKTGPAAEKAKAELLAATQNYSPVAAQASRLDNERKTELEFGTAKGVGRSLFNLHNDDQHNRFSTSYMVPFELLSLLIVAAMMGSVILSKPRVMREPVVDSSAGESEIVVGAGHKE